MLANAYIAMIWLWYRIIQQLRFIWYRVMCVFGWICAGETFIHRGVTHTIYDCANEYGPVDIWRFVVFWNSCPHTEHYASLLFGTDSVRVYTTPPLPNPNIKLKNVPFNLIRI